MTDVFVDIDTQFDFVYPEGKLYVPGAETIVENLKRLFDKAKRSGMPVISSVDAHVENDPEFRAFPPHCVKGTDGQKKIPETLLESTTVIPNVTVRRPQIQPAQQFIFEKDTFSIFSNPNINKFLSSQLRTIIGKEVTKEDVTFWVFGLATDYCVKAGALGLRNLGLKVNLVTDAIKAVAPETGEKSLEEMKASGITLMTTDECLRFLSAAGAARGR